MSAQAATNVAAAADEPDGRLVRTRRLWTGTDTNDYVSRSISPDGRYLLEADPYGELGVRDLATGDRHALAGSNVSGYVGRAIFSPTGDRIVSERYNERVDDYELWMQDFRIDDVGTPRGGDPRLIVPFDRDVVTYVLGGWSDDDEILTAVWRPGGTLALALLSLRTDAITILKSLAWDEPEVTMTRDARLIAYSVPASDDRDDSDIFLIVDGTRETPLAEGPSDDRVLGWLPGTTDLLFVSDRSGSPGIWRQPIVDERPVGPPMRLRDELWNLRRIRGASRDAFYYGVRVENPRVVTARLDAETGALLPLPTSFADARGGRIRTLDWSPDGQYVAYDVVRPGQALVIVVRSADGTEVREWEFDLNMTRVALRWTPDGRGIVLNAFDPKGREALRRIDLESGSVETIRELGSGEINFGNPGGFAVHPDGRRLFYVYRDRRGLDQDEATARTTIVSHDLSTGQEETLYRLGASGVLEISPDGVWLAALTRGREQPHVLRLVPVDGGDPRVLHVLDEHRDERAERLVGWSPDSEWLYFSVRPAEAPSELWRVSVTGGDARMVGPEVPAARLHPDGRTIAYWTGETRNEIWAMDGFAGASSAATPAP